MLPYQQLTTCPVQKRTGHFFERLKKSSRISLASLAGWCYTNASPQGEHVRKVRAMFDTLNPDSPYFLDYVEELTAWYPEEEEDYEDYEDYED